MGLSAQQIEARASGIGGSDVAALCGLNPNKTPVQLWQEKTGRVPPENLDDVEIVQWGKILEDSIATEWARRRGEKIMRVNTTLRHPVHPFMVGNIDRRIVGKNRPLEVKNASVWTMDKWGESGSDDVPLYYLTQGVHYTAIMGADACEFGVLLGGNELRWYVVPRDMTVESQLIELEAKFWRCVETDTPPEPIKVEDLVRLYPKSQGAKVSNEKIALAVAEASRLAEERKAIEKREKELKLEIGAYMGDAGDLLDPFDSSITIATYRAHDEERIDVKRLRAEFPDVAKVVAKTNVVRKFLWK